MDLLYIISGLLAMGVITFGPWMLIVWILDKVWD